MWDIWFEIFNCNKKICLGEIFFSGTKDLAFFAKSLVHFKFLSNGDQKAKIMFVALLYGDKLENPVCRRASWLPIAKSSSSPCGTVTNQKILFVAITHSDKEEIVNFWQ